MVGEGETDRFIYTEREKEREREGGEEKEEEERVLVVLALFSKAGELVTHLILSLSSEG